MKLQPVPCMRQSTKRLFERFFFVLLFIVCLYFYNFPRKRRKETFEYTSDKKLCTNFGKKICGLPFSSISERFTKDLKYIANIEHFENEEVVFITYASSNHYAEAKGALLTIRNITKQKIIFYDLGLKRHQYSDLLKVCNLEIVSFPFDQYPTFVSNLMTYSFKPLLILESYKRFNAFWILDASVRFTDGQEMLKFYEKVRNVQIEPFSVEHPTGHSIEAATNSEMYNYLLLPEEARKYQMLQALTMFIVRSQMSREIIKLLAACALTRSCIAPTGSTVDCLSKFCHRFDQSALSIILCSYHLIHGRNCTPMSQTNGSFSSFATVKRDARYNGDIPC